MPIPTVQVEPTIKDQLTAYACDRIFMLPPRIGVFAARCVAMVPAYLFVGITGLFHACGASFKPKRLDKYIVTLDPVGKATGHGVRNICMMASWVTSIPGKVLGHVAGRIVGGIAGVAIIGSANLINAAFNTNLKTRTIKEYSASAAKTLEYLGGLASSAATAALCPIVLAPIIGSGCVFEHAEYYGLKLAHKENPNINAPKPRGPYTPPKLF